jgi:hypothetical protein
MDTRLARIPSLMFVSILYVQNGKRMVQEGALTALASVADSAQVFCQLPF